MGVLNPYTARPKLIQRCMLMTLELKSLKNVSSKQEQQQKDTNDKDNQSEHCWPPKPHRPRGHKCVCAGLGLDLGRCRCTQVCSCVPTSPDLPCSRPGLP